MHLEGYIRNASLGSVPKIANLLSLNTSITFLVHLDNHVVKGYFFSKAYRLVCFTLLIAFQVGYLILDHFVVRVAYG